MGSFQSQPIDFTEYKDYLPQLLANYEFDSLPSSKTLVGSTVLMNYFQKSKEDKERIICALIQQWHYLRDKLVDEGFGYARPKNGDTLDPIPIPIENSLLEEVTNCIIIFKRYLPSKMTNTGYHPENDLYFTPTESDQFFFLLRDCTQIHSIEQINSVWLLYYATNNMFWLNVIKAVHKYDKRVSSKVKAWAFYTLQWHENIGLNSV